MNVTTTDTDPIEGQKKIRRLILVAGLSGAGKSSTLKYLEDIGFFWMDNLPLQLLAPSLTQLADEIDEGRFEGIAIGVHIRNKNCLLPFQKILQDIASLAERFELVFLETSTDVLVTRYRETRRRHPLAIHCTVREAVEMEIGFMAGVRSAANVIIDTTRMNVPRLKQRIDDLFEKQSGPDLMIFLRSFGFRNGTNTDMDMVLDARFLPNPYYDPQLRSFTGKDEPVRHFLLGESEVSEMLDRLEALFTYLIPRFIREKKRYLTVDIGCTGGRHRSVFMVEELARRLHLANVLVLVRHRDLDKPLSDRDG